MHLQSPIDLTDESSVVGSCGALPGLWVSIHCPADSPMVPIVEATLDQFSRLWAMNLT